MNRFLVFYIAKFRLLFSLGWFLLTLVLSLWYYLSSKTKIFCISPLRTEKCGKDLNCKSQMHNNSSTDCNFQSVTNVYMHWCHLGLLSQGWWGESTFPRHDEPFQEVGNSDFWCQFEQFHSFETKSHICLLYTVFAPPQLQNCSLLCSEIGRNKTEGVYLWFSHSLTGRTLRASYSWP